MANYKEVVLLDTTALTEATNGSDVNLGSYTQPISGDNAGYRRAVKLFVYCSALAAANDVVVKLQEKVPGGSTYADTPSGSATVSATGTVCFIPSAPLAEIVRVVATPSSTATIKVVGVFEE